MTQGAEPEHWLAELVAHRNHNIAAVALANKIARAVWALLYVSADVRLTHCGCGRKLGLVNQLYELPLQVVQEFVRTSTLYHHREFRTSFVRAGACIVGKHIQHRQPDNANHTNNFRGNKHVMC
jgi:hypothetical protein